MKQYKRLFCICICLFCLLVMSCARSDNNKALQYKEKNIEIHEDLKGNSFCDLVGYDAESVYYSLLLDDCIKFYKSIDGELAELYVSKAEVITYQEIFDSKLLLCEIGYTDAMTFSVKMIDSERTLEILSGECYGYPEVHLIGNYLVVGYSEMDGCYITQRLLQYDMFLDRRKELLCKKYVFDDDGKVTGTLLQAFDGFESGIVIEEIEFYNEDMYLDETGKSTLYYYDFTTERYIKIPIDFERKMTYVSGNSSIVVTSDYANKEPLYNTGNVYFLENDEVICLNLEGIESGNDIVDVYKLSDYIMLIQTRQDIYMVDLNTRMYDRVEGIRNIKVYEESFAYLNQNNELTICYPHLE